MDTMAEMMQMEEQIQKMEQYGAKQRIRKKLKRYRKKNSASSENRKMSSCARSTE